MSFLIVGEIFEIEKDYENAINHYKNVFRVSQKKMGPTLKIARCYEKLKNFENAVKTYEKAIKIDKFDYLPYYKYTISYEYYINFCLICFIIIFFVDF